jgi:hypothetical protein
LRIAAHERRLILKCLRMRRDRDDPLGAAPAFVRRPIRPSRRSGAAGIREPDEAIITDASAARRHLATGDYHQTSVDSH